MASHLILTEEQSVTTTENAVNTLALLSERCPQVTDIVIISSDYHMFNGVEAFRNQAQTMGLSINVTAGESWKTY